MSTNRLNVFPSRMVLTAMKDRLKAAKKGHSLLKQKSDAIKMNLHKILKEILVTKREVGVLVRDAAFSHTEAVFAAGEFNNDVIQNVSQASYRIRATIDHTAGVQLPIFLKQKVDITSSDEVYGLSRGGDEINSCAEIYKKTLEGLVKLASLQTSLKTLDDALKVTNRRVNALEFVIMPKIGNTINYIMSELYEQEREDTYRIKKVKDLRQAAVELEKLEKMAENNIASDDEDETQDGMTPFLDDNDAGADDIVGAWGDE